MYVIASQAALLLQIPYRRLLELLGKGRVKGAYKSGRFWLIPLYNGLPNIIPGKRGRKGQWVKTRLLKKERKLLLSKKSGIIYRKIKMPEIVTSIRII